MFKGSEAGPLGDGIQSSHKRKESTVPQSHQILERGLRNVVKNGKTIGFQLLFKSSYYRGIYLALIDDLEVTVDQEVFGRDKIEFTTPDGTHTYSVEELSKATDIHWQWLEPAKLTVARPGGLKPGVHDVKVVEKNRIAYMPIVPAVRTYTAKMTMVP